MSTTIATVIGLGAIVGAICVALIGAARRAGNPRRKPPRDRTSRPAPMSTLIPSLCHPLAVDATASEFDDVPRSRFMPVGLLTEPKGREEVAPTKSF